MKNLSRYTNLFLLETSLLMRGLQMGEPSKLGWLIGLVKHAIWADSLYFLHMLLLEISSLLYDPLRRHVGIILIFLEDPVGDYACVHEAARLEFCLFRQCSFCHIHRGYCGCTVPSVADLFAAWFS
jgi:hypothetical protein